MFSRIVNEFTDLPVSRQALLVTAGVGGIALFSAGAYLAKRHIENTPPKQWRKAGELAELYVFPIKSCAPVVLQQIACSDLGLQRNLLRDRIFMVTNPDGKFVTARMKPKMVLVQPRFDERFETMFLTAPGMPELRVDIRALMKPGGELEAGRSTVWGETVPTVDCGQEAARWFSRYLLDKDDGYRLRYYPLDYTSRRRNGADTGSLQDETSYMLFNEASVADLNQRLENKVTSLQFRPNFIVRGPEAYAEDRWRWVRIGETIFRYEKPCLRCIFTTIDPESGVAHPDKEPLRTLKQYRQIPSLGESPALGIHLGVRRAGEVKVGDPVYFA
ncbi:mitochondrial amidoxime reducing component 2-like isoform X1 [Anopheles nili]|uniref:mitochondrial amidoxime reducing component 2-like isoform X1 n=1 Tax=Anopheles nili TaxID=185578 RepID=UPI00237BCE1E|nr:mitochondrial amidoxime reducing component 2-like isoform X1 [Anopheles nili]